MNDISAFIHRCEVLSALTGQSLSTLSTKLFSSGARIATLKNNGDIGVKRLHQAELALRAMAKTAGVNIDDSIPPPDSSGGDEAICDPTPEPAASQGAEPIVYGEA